MKRFPILMLLLLLGTAGRLFSQGVESGADSNIEPWKAAYGDWRMMDERLVQSSTKAGMAQAYLGLQQTGVLEYRFDAKFLDGVRDRYAGFGVHVGIDRPHVRKSWGNGKSFLLWLTYDPAAYGGWGLYAQGYRSFRHSHMKLLHAGGAYPIPGRYLKQVDLNKLEQYRLPVKLVIDYDSGQVKVYDPFNPNRYYRFSLGQPLHQGLYIAIRTNSLAASFGNFKIRRLR